LKLQLEDSIIAYGKSLILAALQSRHLDNISIETKELLSKILKLSIDDKVSPRINLKKDPDASVNDVFKRVI